MDYDKIREFVRQAHPKRRPLANESTDPADAADGSEQDVDAGNFKLSTWKKFGGKGNEEAMSPGESNPREKFRPRRLTGGAKAADSSRVRRANVPDRPAAANRGDAGKIALERLTLNPQGADDASEDSLDLLVDEEHGIIGESDSGPEDTPRRRR